MAAQSRLDIRVDGRTRFSRTVDKTIIEAVLKASAPEPEHEPESVVKDFSGRQVKQAKAKQASTSTSQAERPKPHPRSSSVGTHPSDTPEKSLGSDEGNASETD